MIDRLDREAKAYAAYQRAIDAIRECQVCFDNAAIPVPDRVRRFLDDAPASSAAGRGTPPLLPILPPPPPPQRPQEVRQNWIWVPVDKVTPTTLVRALLRGAGRPITPAELKEHADAVRAKPLSGGVLANIGTRLDKKLNQIVRGEDGWVLNDAENGPVLHKGNVWGPRESFDTQDLAEHRRIGVEHLLRIHPDGLQMIQVTRLLERCDWLQAPHTKDLVKVDLYVLKKESRVRPIGASGKWRAVEVE